MIPLRSAGILAIGVLAVAGLAAVEQPFIIDHPTDQTVTAVPAGSTATPRDPAGTSATLTVGSLAGVESDQALVRFDLSSLPTWSATDGRHLERATLRLRVTGLQTTAGSGPARLAVYMLNGRNAWRAGAATATRRDDGLGWYGTYPDGLWAWQVGEMTIAGTGDAVCDVTSAVRDWIQGIQGNAGLWIRVAKPPGGVGSTTILRVRPDPTPFDGLVRFASGDASSGRPTLTVTYADGPTRFRPPVAPATRPTPPYRIGYVGGAWVFQRPDLFSHLTLTTAGASDDDEKRMNHYGMQVLRWAPGPSQNGSSQEWYASRYAMPANGVAATGIGVDEWGGNVASMSYSAAALRQLRRDHPSQFIAVWEINRGPELQDLLRDGTVDVALIEGYVHIPNQHGWRADFTETMRRAQVWKDAGLIHKVVIGWGQMTGEIDDTGVAMAAGQIIWNMREAKRRYPEMPGVGFFFATQGGWTPMNEALLMAARDCSLELYPRSDDPPLEPIQPSGGTGTGAILREVWNHLPVDGTLADVPFSATPSLSQLRPMALSPRNTGDNHGSRLRGWVHPPATGDYVFAIAADDVAELWLSSSDRPMDAIRIATCDSWSDVAEFHLRAATQRSRPIPLQAGRRYYIEARHREGTGNDHVDIAWEGPGFHQQVIEGAFLSPWHDMIADGIGLTGSYWQGKASFAGFPVVVRVDPTVDSAWNGVAPTPGLGSSDFTVRWSGSVLAPASGTFTFTTTSDDGVRLWVDGQPVISHWNDHATASDSGICVLTAGRRHRLVMEYYQGGGGAVARLAWSGPSITSQIIPASHLYPDPFPAMGGALPAGWCSFGLGDGAGHGSAGVLDGVWTVTSAGGDIWDRADGCQFVGQAVIGDVQITARVQRLQATHAWSKAGVMIREFATAGARQAFMAVTPASGIAFQRRLQPDGPSSHTAGVRAAAPYWVRLVRSGTAISAWQSPDNAVWTRIGTATVAMGTTVQVGLAVSSHASDSATAIIDQVKIINAPQGSG